MKNTSSVLVEAVAPVDGPKETMVSYRSETFGALAIVTLLNHLGKKFHIESGTMQIYVDNMETVQTITGGKYMYNTASSLQDNIDVALELQYHIKNSPFVIQGQHVKAHMDDIQTI